MKGSISVGNYNKSFFENPSAELSYFMGLFAADGSLYKFKRADTYAIKFKCKRSDENILLGIHSWLGLRSKVTRSAEVLKVTGKSYPYTEISFSSKWVGEWLKQHGIHERKSTSMGKIDFPLGYEAQFVKGYIDGDGCFTHSGKYNYPCLIVQGTEIFLCWLDSIIEKECGAVLTGVYKEYAGIFRLAYMVPKEVEKVRNWLRKVPQGLQRKLNSC